MANEALRPVRHEEIQAGEFVWLITGVEMGHDGFKNLLHFLPFGQNDWQFFASSGGHDFLNDFDAVTSRVTARQQATIAASRTSQIRKRILLPEDFGFFPDIALRLITKASATLPDTYTITLLKNGMPDPGVNGVSIMPVLGGVFEFFELTPTAEYFPGDLVTLEVELVTSANSVFAEIADIEFDYKTARGNV